MRLYKQLLTQNDCYRAGAPLAPKGIMWHSTGANNKKLSRYVQPDDGILGTNKYNNDWNRPRPDGRQVCVHAFIGVDKNGAVATYQTLPWDMRGWHAGVKAGNDNYIGFEICEDALVDKAYFQAVYKEACELTAYLCRMYNLDPMADGVVICHSEGYTRRVASNHSDVMHWFKKHGYTMTDARRDVKALMEKSNQSAPAPTQPTQSQASAEKPQIMYRVQCGAFRDKANATALCEKLKKDGYSAIVVASTK